MVIPFINHPTKKFKDINNIPLRWQIKSHPLYQKAREELGLVSPSVHVLQSEDEDFFEVKDSGSSIPSTQARPALRGGISPFHP